MKSSRSKIIIEDYKNNFTYKKNETNLNIQFNRVAFIFFLFFIIYLIYSIHLIHLGSRKSKLDKIDNIPTFSNKLYRADITDINGNYLAKTVSSIDVGIKTSDVIDKEILLINLRNIFPKKNFIKIEKQLETRIYPQKNLFSHIIGQIDNDNNGISGLEKSFNEILRKSKKPIKLTVDKDIQFLVRRELIKYQEIFRSKGSAAILMNVNNGKILSIISLPDFDPNKRQNIIDVNFINRITKGTYELGSVFKTFTIASGINAGLIEPKTEFLDSKKKIKCGKNHTIKEYDDEMPSDLTAEEILIKSGNIGSVRIVRKIGIEEHKLFLKTIGVLDKIDFDIEEVGSPQSIDWYEGCKLETISFGHGITTTILQLAKGYAILSNGGFDIKPTLINKFFSKNKKKNRLLKKGVSKKIVGVLRKIVGTEEGTAKLADVSNYEIAGKTGTAQQPDKGEYTRTKINTFASVFPSSSPKYVFVVMMDSPKTSSSYIYNYRHKKGTQTGTPFNTAGWTSVEVAGKIIDKIGPILATKYIEIN
jgi:cell division protein FtsI (penicillin-binding protein 3)